MIRRTLIFFTILALLNIFVFSISKESDSEKALNDMFKKLFDAHYKKSDVIANSPPVQPDQDYVAYRKQMYDHIMSRGKHTEQYEAHKNIHNEGSRGKTVSPLFRSFLALKMKTAIPSTDDPFYFFGDRSYIADVTKLPQQGQCNVNPWSSTHWATRYGGISVRYPNSQMNSAGVPAGNRGYSSNYNWHQSVTRYYQPSEYNQYSSSPRFTSYVDSWYSPSEKYDLAHGDVSFTLTNYQKQEGAQYLKNGDVPTWYGICHGWVLAAYLYPTPTKPVTITGATGNLIRFYPDDVKAIASLFYANAKYTTRWIGARCDFAPGQPGWYTSAACRSLNPGSFLLAITNWMGIRNKCAVLDPKADAEIWNQPWKQYQIRYYNIIEGRFYSDADSAKVATSQLQTCGTARCRSALASNRGADYVVGCFFYFTYIVETNPIHNLYTAPDQPKTDTYDSFISLDQNMNVTGGSWNTSTYPNFCWMPAEGEKIQGINDDAVTSFTGTSAELKNNLSYAKSSSRKGQVLKAFIDWLVAQSSAPTQPTS